MTNHNHTILQILKTANAMAALAQNPETRNKANTAIDCLFGLGASIIQQKENEAIAKHMEATTMCSIQEERMRQLVNALDDMIKDGRGSMAPLGRYSELVTVNKRTGFFQFNPWVKALLEDKDDA